MKDIFWVGGKNAPNLAIVMRPRGGVGLAEELRRMKRGGIETVVSLLEPFEAEMLGLAEEGRLAEAAGLEFLSHPIPDTRVPSDTAAFRRFASGLGERLALGEHVGVHCRACIGRATMTAACALVHLGWLPARALVAIRRARGVQVPDTAEQKAWILRYRAGP